MTFEKDLDLETVLNKGLLFGNLDCAAPYRRCLAAQSSSMARRAATYFSLRASAWAAVIRFYGGKIAGLRQERVGLPFAAEGQMGCACKYSLK